MDVAIPLVQSKYFAALCFDRVTDGTDATGQALKDTLDIAAVLHGDDAELVLLIHPQQEGLGLIVEDAAALRPVPLHTGNLGATRANV